VTVERLSIREIARRTGHDRWPPSEPFAPRCERAEGAAARSVKDEIERLVQADPRLPGRRVRELLSELGLWQDNP
jgi:hypothetical protein